MIYTDKKFAWLKTAQINLRKQPRCGEAFESELNFLTESISEIGMLEPLIVRKTSIKGYELISGYRRLAAAKKLYMRRVPCIICMADDKKAALIYLADNLQRKPLSFFKKSELINAILKNSSLSIRDLSKKLGMPKNELVSLLSLNEIDDTAKERIVNAGLDEAQAQSVLSLPEKLRAGALDIIIGENLDAFRTERLIASLLSPSQRQSVPSIIQEEKEPKEPMKKMQIGDMRIFENSIVKLVDSMQNAGISAYSKQNETTRYIEYKIRIEKQKRKEYTQLKIC